MVARIYNFPTVMAGDTWSKVGLELLFWSDVAKTVPILMDNNDIVMQIRTNFTTEVITYQVRKGAGITVYGNSVLIEPFVVTFKPAVYVYDIQITYEDSTIQTYLQGTFTVKADATK